MELMHIGTFNLSNGDKLLIGDPYYSLGSEFTYVANFCQKGLWEAYIKVDNSGIKQLIAVHQDCRSQVNYLSTSFKPFGDNEAEVSVDSDLMAITDLGVDLLYSEYAEALSLGDSLNEKGAIISNSGVVVDPNYTDGSFPLYLFKDGKTVWGVLIDFDVD